MCPYYKINQPRSTWLAFLEAPCVRTPHHLLDDCPNEAIHDLKPQEISDNQGLDTVVPFVSPANDPSDCRGAELDPKHVLSYAHHWVSSKKPGTFLSRLHVFLSTVRLTWLSLSLLSFNTAHFDPELCSSPLGEQLYPLLWQGGHLLLGAWRDTAREGLLLAQVFAKHRSMPTPHLHQEYTQF